ncbi:MAG: isoleucine--tRNA ligase [Gemmatimonadetes bacterium]|nr:isoleucine--tRNA ligase [Gemmatimonadota bacterium]
MAYEPLGNLTPDALERELLARWKDEKLFQQTLAATRNGTPFVFYEGPPTANGKPGVHHVFARTIKDLICRFHAMQGESVTRIAGWDTHGLAVEIEVEKALGLSGKPDIEKFGVEEFNRRCRDSVFQYKKDWESLSDRIAYWLDYDHPYVTYSNEYIESVWWLLAQLHKKGLLFEGPKVLPYCIRCGTALSSHELAQGYDTHKSPSIYALFRLADGPMSGWADEAGPSAQPPIRASARHLLAWTTTPWTLPSNVAIAVNPDFTYVELDVDGTRLIVEQGIAERKSIHGATHGKPLASFPKLGEFSGRELVGWRYHQLIDAVPVTGDAFRVVAGDFVTKEDGTGLVHMAPAFGADDYATVKREGLAFFNVVDPSGRFAGTTWAEINGKTVFEATPVIAERLEKEGKVFGRYEPEGHEHSYPFCWRCDSPLIYYAKLSWFVRTTAFKDRMIEFNRGVHWHPPEMGTGRFGEWLENNVDWALSRDRYWGTPLPIWVCGTDTAHKAVMGSYADLEARLKRGGQGLPKDFDPHKPFIDRLTFPCDQCSGTMKRVPEVIDAWFDSGAMPCAQWHYPFEHEKEFKAHFPADYICEGIDQTRGWFYSLIAIATGVFDQTAYRNVIVNGHLLDPDGRKMSKRLGNLVNPWEMIERFGADAVRVFLLASGQVGLQKRFDPNAIREVALGFLTRLRNTYGFFALYAEDWRPAKATPVARRPAVDRWLVSRLDGLTQAVRDAWSGYDVTAGTRAIIEFCDDDLSNWYVRVNRARFWAPNAAADPLALETLHEALATVARLVAPAAPFLSDALHRRLAQTPVHLAGFPDSGGRRDTGLESAMSAVRVLASLARAAREDAGIRVRQPLSRLKVALPRSVSPEVFRELLDLLQIEVNVKDIEVAHAETDIVRLKGKPNFRTLGKVYGKDTPRAAAAVAGLGVSELSALERGESVRISSPDGEYDYRPEDVVVEREVAAGLSGWLVKSEGQYVVALDPALTPDLAREGIAREVVNRVQRMRKEAGYEYSDRIELSVSGAPEIVEAVRAEKSLIFGETLARYLVEHAELADPDIKESVDIDGRGAVIALKRWVEKDEKKKTVVGQAMVKKKTAPVRKTKVKKAVVKKKAAKKAKPRRKGK